jgi:hypothetical protein
MASTASAQTEQNRPGTGGTSKRGIQGLPGGKWDTAVKDPNTTMPAPTARIEWWQPSAGRLEGVCAACAECCPRTGAGARGTRRAQQSGREQGTGYARRQIGALIEIISVFLRSIKRCSNGWLGISRLGLPKTLRLAGLPSALRRATKKVAGFPAAFFGSRSVEPERERALPGVRRISLLRCRPGRWHVVPRQQTDPFRQRLQGSLRDACVLARARGMRRMRRTLTPIATRKSTSV